MSEQPETERPVIQRRLRFRGLYKAIDAGVATRPLSVGDTPAFVVYGRVIESHREPTKQLVKAEQQLAKAMAIQDPKKRPNLALLTEIRDLEAGKDAEVVVYEVHEVKEVNRSP